ncbi:sensor histidine kinase [Oceanospirillum sediminis]|uniref:histidine kinase n=1 Tax=Oceanospirillum sediminis TaxID=2760088 RepID=A0A839IUA6_9GAMM|nr:ATP-binding protein [Oceanospirillum sediminis]MBB1489033.1 GHKL domain-containing protein [Oceanospirillum sediminis]
MAVEKYPSMLRQLCQLILLPIIILMITLTAGQVFFQLTQSAEKRENYRNEQIDQITGLLAKAIFDADKNSVNLIGDSLFRNQDITHLMISDQFSRLYLKNRTSPDSEAERILDPLVISRPLSYQLPSGERVLMGNVTAHFTNAAEQALFSASNIWFVFACMIDILLISFIIYMVLKYKLVSPIAQLTDQLRRNRPGQFKPIIIRNSFNKEIAQLARLCNDLQENNHIHHLRQKEIRDKLIERTHEVAEGKESSRLLTNMLQSSQKRYRALFHRNIDPVLIVEPYRVGAADINRIIDANQAALNLLQLPLDNLTHQDFEDKFGIKPMEHGNHRLPEGVLASQYGALPKHIELHFNMVVYENHSLYYVTLKDITDKVRAETLEKEANDLMSYRQNQMAISEMATTIAHELNQPLAAIRNYSQSVINFSLQDSELNREKITESLRQLKQQADIASDIVKQARGQSGRNDYPQEPLEMVKMIQNTIELCQLRADKENVVLEFNSATIEAWVVGNEVQLKQLMINLISNAIEIISETQAQTRSVTLHLLRNDEQYQLDVMDTGPGIEDIDRVFTTHYTTKKNGLGMGLSICRSIAEMHQSSIFATNLEHGGACFTLCIPVFNPDNTQPPAITVN